MHTCIHHSFQELNCVYNAERESMIYVYLRKYKPFKTNHNLQILSASGPLAKKLLARIKKK